MEHLQDAQALVTQADAQLIAGQVREAADDYSRALQLDPTNVGGHLGIAKSYLALGSYGYVYAACREVLRLAPGTAEAAIAQAIQNLLATHYDAALADLDHAETLRPGQPYVHALRAYCYRQLGNRYDAQSAESKASRLSGQRDWKHLIPVAQPLPLPAVAGQAGAGYATPSASSGAPATPSAMVEPSRRPERVGWEQPARPQRQQTRPRTGMFRHPAPVTYALIFVNVAIYLICAVVSHSLLYPTPQDGIVNPAALTNPLYLYGDQLGALIPQDPVQAYRIVTAMFLHANYLHIGLNMWSLYVVGIITEQIFGSRRYAFIYFASGILAGATEAIASPNIAALGASGAIFGIFGAFGAAIYLRRRALGPAARPMLMQWVFVVVINLVFSVVDPQIALYDHVGGLVSGVILGAILISVSTRQRMKA